jgi:single-strand DNA-binding protein
MNRIEIIGRLTKDVDLNTTTNGVSVAKFSIAVNRKFKDENGESIADFFNVVAWRGLGETIHKYCKKGSKVFIAGELQNRSWEKEDGTKTYITEIIANECEFLDTKSNDTEPKQEKPKLEPVDDDSLPF